MKELKELQADLSSAREAYKKCELNIKDKSEEINRLNLELSELSSRATDVARLLNNAKKGIGMSLSMDELTSLKKELEDKNNRIHELKEFIPLMKNSLSTLKGTSTGNSRHIRSIKDQITNIIADKAAEDIVYTSSIKLKELTHTSMALYGGSYTGKAEDKNGLYQQIGERICKQLFNNENESSALPSIQQSMTERDGLIENLA